MNEQQLKEAFMQYLQLKSGAQTQQEFEAYIQQLGEEGLQQEYAQFMQMMQQQLVAARKFGGMLNYVERLRGVCPEGYEMQFFKQGGQICKKCVLKAKMEDGGKTPENPIDAFRCGRKMKKKACGGTVKEAKCGTKVEMDKCGKKMKKKACGGSVEKAQEGTKAPANFADKVNSSPDMRMGLKWRPLQNGKGAVATDYRVSESGTPYSTTAILTPSKDLFMFSPGNRDYPNDLYDGRNISDLDKIITPEQSKVAMRELLRPAPFSSDISGYLRQFGTLKAKMY